MSYEVVLQDASGAVQVPTHLHVSCGTSLDHRLDGEGRLYPGSSKAELSITSNYRFIFVGLWDEEGIERLYGKKAHSTIKGLEEAVALLGTERSGNPWEPTLGNVGHVLSILLEWARMHPDATWKILK